jgi:hypothetical protein
MDLIHSCLRLRQSRMPPPSVVAERLNVSAKPNDAAFGLCINSDGPNSTKTKILLASCDPHLQMRDGWLVLARLEAEPAIVAHAVPILVPGSARPRRLAVTASGDVSADAGTLSGGSGRFRWPHGPV